MNDQSQLISQAPQLMNHCQMLNHPPPQVMSSQLMGKPQILGHGQGGMYGTSSQATMANRNYKPWQPKKDANPNKIFHGTKSGFERGNWKGKKPNEMRKESWRGKNQHLLNSAISGGGGYQPPTLNELQSQNSLKARKFYPKKRFNNRFAPYAPRNTSSFIMRAKKSGGIASLVSPGPVTPAVLQTPRFSPSREFLVDMAKEEWGVDGYGSMKGFIRLRNEADNRDNEDDDEEVENEEENNASSGESDVEENNVLSRLDHEMSRFEMVYPNDGMGYSNVLENRVDDQDRHIAQLEEENLLLKDRLFLMERELGDLRIRMQSLERQNQQVEYINEVIENSSENEIEEASDFRGMGDESKEKVEYVDAGKSEGNGDSNVVAVDM